MTGGAARPQGAQESALPAKTPERGAYEGSLGLQYHAAGHRAAAFCGIQRPGRLAFRDFPESAGAGGDRRGAGRMLSGGRRAGGDGPKASDRRAGSGLLRLRGGSGAPGAVRRRHGGAVFPYPGPFFAGSGSYFRYGISPWSGLRQGLRKAGADAGGPAGHDGRHRGRLYGGSAPGGTEVRNAAGRAQKGQPGPAAGKIPAPRRRRGEAVKAGGSRHGADALRPGDRAEDPSGSGLSFHERDAAGLLLRGRLGAGALPPV